MASNWKIVEAPSSDVQVLSQALGLPEPIAAILIHRGYKDPALAEKFLARSMQDLVSPFELHGMKDAADRVVQAIRDGERILIHGDFDADGITSCSVLYLFLKKVGADVTAFVPNRLIEGHGISPRAMEMAKTEDFRLMITCDCGVSSVEEIERLAKDGIQTIVTDHHQIPDVLPRETIIVNPQFDDQHEAHDDLSGVGVAFMLAVAVRAALREAGHFGNQPEPNLKELLDIVALGTVADLAPLRGQNRILVHAGLVELLHSERPGIQMLRERIGINNGRNLIAEDIGFRFAPRINAAARLGHSEEALELLITPDLQRANELSEKLEAWNTERKSMQERMWRLAAQEAQWQVEADEPGIVVASTDFHPGIIGLVAQRLSQEFSRPAFVFALEEKLARGSARSPQGIHLVRALDQFSQLLESYGGHAEAGGCVIQKDRLGEFRKEFFAALRKQTVAAAREIFIDAEVKLRHLNERFLFSINRLRPFGIGNPEPVFLAEVHVLGAAREVGANHIQARVKDSDGPSFSVIGFGLWSKLGSVLRGRVRILYTPKENEWMGNREIQLHLKDVQAV